VPSFSVSSLTWSNRCRSVGTELRLCELLLMLPFILYVLDLNHLHDLVAEVVDYFDGDATGKWFGEGERGVAVERELHMCSCFLKMDIVVFSLKSL